MGRGEDPISRLVGRVEQVQDNVVKFVIERHPTLGAIILSSRHITGEFIAEQVDLLDKVTGQVISESWNNLDQNQKDELNGLLKVATVLPGGKGLGLLKWTPHAYKHFPPNNKKWSHVIESTKHGPAKYKPEVQIEELERSIWKNGKKVSNGKNWKIQEFEYEIGASGGKPSRWIRVENSGNTIHGHPITRDEYRRLEK